jgi:hypothetical protein
MGTEVERDGDERNQEDRNQCSDDGAGELADE